MSEEALNKEVQNSEQEKETRIKESIERLTNKKSKFLFCVPDITNPTAAIYEIYFHATTVKKMGYETIILTEKEEQEIPSWIEKEMTDFKHVSMIKNEIKVSPDDIMVIPEVFSNIMEQTKNLPCLRVGLLQSVDYMLNALIPGTNWKSFGINDIITTSKTMEEFVESFYGKKVYNIKTYNVGIPEYFNKIETLQKPIISIIGRNPNEISKLVKLFFARYPQYSWVTFDPMLTKSKPPQQMRRKDFAERLKNNFAAVWIDRISSFGTFPLECMKSGVIPIGLKPDITPEYLLERDEKGEVVKIVDGAGVWTDNYYDLPVLIGEVLIKYLDDTIGDTLYKSMENIVSKYTQEKSEEDLNNVYEKLVNERIGILNNAITPKEPTEK